MKQTSATVLLIVVGAVTCFVVAAAVVIFVAAPEGANTGSLIALLIGIIPTTAASLAALAKVDQTGKVVDDLANGKMDAKIRAGLADLLPEHQIKPEAREQVARDRIRRNT